MVTTTRAGRREPPGFGHNWQMTQRASDSATAEVIRALRAAGARFGYLHGSRATWTQRPDSDVDIAAYFGGPHPESFEILRWESTTRKIYFDELPRIRRAHDEFAASRRGG